MVALAPFIAPAIGGALSLFGGRQRDRAAEKAAKEAQELQEEMIDAQYERNLQSWEIDNLRMQRDFFWEQATVEQLRKLDLQQAVNQAEAGQRLIWSAAQEFGYNASALFDQYVVGEGLRLGAETLGYEYQQQQLNDQMGVLNANVSALKAQVAALGPKGQELDARAALTTAQTQMEVQGYLNSVLENGARARVIGAEAGQKVDRLVTTLAGEEMEVNQAYEVGILAAALDDAVQGNRAITRSGGGQSAKMLAMNAMKRGLRAYGDVKLRRDRRAAALGVLMSEINDVDAKKIEALAIQSENAEKLMSHAINVNSKQLGVLDAQRAGLAAERNILQGRYGVLEAQAAQLATQFGFNQANFVNLTLPGFGLQQNAFSRQLGGQMLGLRNQLATAVEPYQFREVFDPLQPIAGLKPEKMVTTPYKAEGGGFLSSAMDFINGAQAVQPNLLGNLGMALGSMFGGGGGGGFNTAGAFGSAAGAGIASLNSGIGSGYGGLSFPGAFS